MVSQNLQIRSDEVRLHLLLSHCRLESLPLLRPLLLFDFLLLLLLGYLRRSVLIADSFDLRVSLQPFGSLLFRHFPHLLRDLDSILLHHLLPSHLLRAHMLHLLVQI